MVEKYKTPEQNQKPEKIRLAGTRRLTQPLNTTFAHNSKYH